MKKILFLLCVITFCSYSCNDESDTITMIIASKIGKSGIMDNSNDITKPIYWVKYGDYPSWQGMDISDLKGFDYEAGYEYVIMVKENKIKNPPADASSIVYQYIKTISKTLKESENLPADFP